MTTDPRSLDFRGLELLCLVHQERSFGRAAEVLGVSQSVVSYAVAKLRDTFGDPLFLRVAGRTEPTGRCDEIVAWAHETLAAFDAVRTTAPFDPAAARGRLVIACNFYERALLIPPVVAMLRGAAPGLDLEIIDAAGTGHERLRAREADLLIGPYQRQDAGFYTRTLLTDGYVCLMDRDHPVARAGAEPSIETYLAFEHILITYGGAGPRPTSPRFERMGHRLDAAIRVPSPAGIARACGRIGLGSDDPGAAGRRPGPRPRHAPLPCLGAVARPAGLGRLGSPFPDVRLGARAHRGHGREPPASVRASVRGVAGPPPARRSWPRRR